MNCKSITKTESLGAWLLHLKQRKETGRDGKYERGKNFISLLNPLNLTKYLRKRSCKRPLLGNRRIPSRDSGTLDGSTAHWLYMCVRSCLCVVNWGIQGKHSCPIQFLPFMNSGATIYISPQLLLARELSGHYIKQQLSL